MLVVIVRGIAGLVLALAAGFVWFLACPPEAAPLTTAADGIVVLTGADGRIRRGADALSAGAGKRMLISGVSPGVAAKELATQSGVPEALFACCIDLGFEATDTRSNAEEVAQWAAAHRYRSLRLVTSDYHMRRARMELAAELGPEIELLPQPVPSASSTRLWLREYTKYLVRLIALQVRDA